MKNNRKTLLINKPFQLSVIGKFTVLALANTLITFGAIKYFFSQVTHEAVKAGLPPEHVFFRFLDDQQGHLTQIFTISSLVTLALIIVSGLWLSHKIAGPIHRLVSYLRTERPSATAPELKFRDGDYFHEIEEAMNAFVRK